MSEKGGGTLGKAAQWGSIVSPVVAVVAIVVAVWLAYQSSTDVREALTNLVELVGPLVAGGVAVLMLGGVAVLMWKFWRQVVRPFTWLGGLGKRFSLWVLWLVVIRPARDHLGIVACEFRSRLLHAVGPIALKMLGMATGDYVAGRTTDDGSVFVSPRDLGLGVETLSGAQIRDHMLAAGDELREIGFVDKCTWSQDDCDVTVRLPRWLTVCGAVRVLDREVADELARRRRQEWRAGHCLE